MIDVIEDMPPGTLGFRSEGHLTGDDYREVLVPPIKATIERGGKIRLMFVVEEDFGESPSGLLEDLKTGASLGAGHLSSWERTALVTDQEWVKKAVRLFGWIAPGEMKLFALSDETAAREWLTA